jgi:hypothetical protein
MSEWHRHTNERSILLFTLKQQGWKRGHPIMVNDVMIRIENAPGSDNDLHALSETILAALTPASDDRAEGLLKEAVEVAKTLRDYLDDASRGTLRYRGQSDISEMAGEDLVLLDNLIAKIEEAGHG